MAGRRTRAAAQASFPAAVVFQLVVLYAPRATSPGTPGVDKAVHAAIFGAVLLTGAWAGVRIGPLAVLLLAHAPVSELIQHTLLPARSGDPLDVLADWAGTGLAFLLVTVVRRREVADPADGGPARRG